MVTNLEVSQRFLQFFLIASFVFAQFFTEQLHELTHYISHTNCEIGALAKPIPRTTHTYESVEAHEHCKFLQIVSAQQTSPFVTQPSSFVVGDLNFTNNVGAEIQSWISYQPHHFHQARAPPLV